MKVWLTKDLEIDKVYNIPPHEQAKITIMNDLNLRNGSKANQPTTGIQEHLTILS